MANKTANTQVLVAPAVSAGMGAALPGAVGPIVAGPASHVSVPPCPLRPACRYLAGGGGHRRLQRTALRVLLRHCAWCDLVPDAVQDELDRLGVGVTSAICPTCLETARTARR